MGSLSFLPSENMNDPAVLRKRIAELESENKKLKDDSNPKHFSTMGKSNLSGMQDKDWMNFGSGPLERPTTANATNQKIKELQEELKVEKKEKKRFMDEIENFKREL